MKRKKNKNVGLIGKFLPYYKPYCGIMAFDLFCAALTTVCELVLPMIVSEITHRGETNPSSLTWKFVLMMGGMYLLLLMISFAGFANWFLLGWYPRLLQDMFGISEAEAGPQATFWINIAKYISVLACAVIADRWYLRNKNARAYVPGIAFCIAGPCVLLVSAVLTAGYLFPIVIRGFIVGNAGHGHGHDEPAEVWERNDAPLMMLIPLLVLAVLSVVLGLFPGCLVELLTKVGELLM